MFAALLPGNRLEVRLGGTTLICARRARQRGPPHLADGIFAFAQALSPAIRQLAHEGIVHQRQRLRRHVRARATAHGRGRLRVVPDHQEGRQEVAADLLIDRAASGAVQRAGAARPTAPLHEAGEVHRHRGAAHLAIQAARRRQDAVPDRFGGQTSRRQVVQAVIHRIERHRALVRAAALTVGARQHDPAQDRLELPVTVAEVDRQRVEQIGVRRVAREHTEVVRLRRDATTEEVVPDAIHRHASDQRPGVLEHLIRELCASAGGTALGTDIGDDFAVKARQHRARHRILRRGGAAPEEQRLVHPVAVEQSRHHARPQHALANELLALLVVRLLRLVERGRRRKQALLVQQAVHHGKALRQLRRRLIAALDHGRHGHEALGRTELEVRAQPGVALHHVVPQPTPAALGVEAIGRAGVQRTGQNAVMLDRREGHASAAHEVPDRAFAQLDRRRTHGTPAAFPVQLRALAGGALSELKATPVRVGDQRRIRQPGCHPSVRDREDRAGCAQIPGRAVLPPRVARLPQHGGAGFVDGERLDWGEGLARQLG